CRYASPTSEKYARWITTDASKYGQLEIVGSGMNGSVVAAIAPAPAAISTTSDDLSGLDLTIAFQPACSAAANNTSNISPSDMFRPSEVRRQSRAATWSLSVQRGYSSHRSALMIVAWAPIHRHPAIMQ